MENFLINRLFKPFLNLILIGVYGIFSGYFEQTTNERPYLNLTTVKHAAF